MKLHHALNLLVAAVWLVFLIPRFRGALFVGAGAVFVLVPIGLIAAFVLERRRPGPTRPYVALSSVLWSLSWFASCLPVLLLVSIHQPWPLSLYYGPDTEFSRGQFRRLYGTDQPTSVEGIYYQHYGIRDGTTFMRFETRDRAVVERMAERLYLEPVEQVGPVTLGVGDWAPSWWVEIRPDSEWTRAEGWERLWYDGASGIALYRSVSF